VPGQPSRVDRVVLSQAGPALVNVDPFFAKIIASSFAGCVWLAFFETS
jgi:hypothetical protein